MTGPDNSLDARVTAAKQLVVSLGGEGAFTGYGDGEVVLAAALDRLAQLDAEQMVVLARQVDIAFPDGVPTC